MALLELLILFLLMQAEASPGEKEGRSHDRDRDHARPREKDGRSHDRDPDHDLCRELMQKKGRHGRDDRRECDFAGALASS